MVVKYGMVMPPEFNAQSIEVAGFWRRLAAFILDLLILGTIGFIVGLFFSKQFVELGPWGRFIGFFVATVYFGFFNSVICRGQTLGKRILHLRVVDRNGKPLSVLKSFVRFFPLGMPYFLNNAQFPEFVLQSFWPYFLSIAILGFGLSVIYLYVFNRVSRQSLHDLVVGSYVVKSDGHGEVQTGKPWRIHYAVCALLLVASGLVPAFTSELAKSESFTALLQLRRSVSGEPWVVHVKAMGGKTFSLTASTGKTERKYVSVTVLMNDGDIGNLDRAVQVAQRVLEIYPAADSLDVIQITLVYGYDIGISSYWRNQNYAFSPQEWRARLKL